MLKEIFHDSFEKLEIYKDFYGKLCIRDCVAKVVFLIQVLLTFGGRSGFLILISFFQRVLTKFFKSKLFSFLAKFDHVTTVMQMAYSLC